MFLCKNNIFTIDRRSITKFIYSRRLFTKNIDVIEEKNIDSKYLSKDFKNNATIIIENEEVYIKYITVPKVKKNGVEKIVRDELRFYYRTDEDIIFSYSILKKNSADMELAVFYINSNSLNIIDFKNINNIKYIYLIQFCYVKYVEKISKLNNYIIAFIYKQNLYFIFCESGLIKYNYIFRNFKESSRKFEDCLEYFTNLSKDIIGNSEMIYLLGFTKETVKSINNIYSFENLGDIELNKLFRAII